ncbi:MAG: 16S rRNA (guanine(966)-N(2))-methyltransferase RsmD [Bacteroidia bacterium]|nr:16S rRNA (guanine(966)-N(2))-methyltransferase RsmD [Bacteroidia bacterium]
MRIIAGELGGRRLRVPAKATFRPTTDRVREALFSMLESRQDWSMLRVCDLFAGSGSLGIEALSRGVLHTVFVERDRRNTDLLRENLQMLGLEKCTEVVCAPAESWLSRAVARFDLVFADPPYDYNKYFALLSGISQLLSGPAALAVIEHRSDVVLPGVSGLTMDTARNYGSTTLTFLRADAGEME